MLCTKCLNIHFRRLNECEVIKREPERLLDEDTGYRLSNCLFYFHHDNKQALEASAADGCHFCEMIRDHLFVSAPAAWGLPAFKFARGEVVFRRSIVDQWIGRQNGFEEWNESDWIYIQCERRNATTTAHGTYRGWLTTTFRQSLPES
jgi:hypothetical protein